MNMGQQLAPIVLFAYNRPAHTEITLEYLSRCRLSKDSHLIIFCDGPKPNMSNIGLENLELVRKIAKSKKWAGKVTVHEHDVNKGLAKNVIEAVTDTVEKYGKVIALEDDLKVGKGFLEYMNQALYQYKDENRVKQISGFLFPIDLPADGSAFFLPVTNTIGWATWKRAWDEVDLTASNYENLKTNRTLRRKFNLDNSYNYYKILINQVERGKNDSWAILYWWSVFKNDGLVLFPSYPLVQHDDFGNEGTHKSNFDHYDTPNWNDNQNITTFPKQLAVDVLAFEKLKRYNKAYTPNLAQVIFHKLKLHLN